MLVVKLFMIIDIEPAICGQDLRFLHLAGNDFICEEVKSIKKGSITLPFLLLPKLNFTGPILLPDHLKRYRLLITRPLVFTSIIPGQLICRIPETKFHQGILYLIRLTGYHNQVPQISRCNPAGSIFP